MLSAAGGTYSNSTASLSFTIGEMPLVNTATGPGFFLTQGFQQGMACEFDGYNAFSDTISICGDSLILDGGNGFIDYDWNTGGKTQRIVVKQNGWYRITVTNNAGCTAHDSTYLSLVAANITQKDTTICRNAELILSVNSGIGTASALKDLPQNLQNGLVAWYPFSGNANDYSGNGYNGTVNGASLTTDRFGLNNGAL